MSVYHNSFSYLGKNSKDDFNLMIAHFSDNADHGETDTFLSTSAVYSDSYDGTRQKFYGARYDSVAEVQITLIKQDGTDFGIVDNRNVLRWLTGSKQATWMDFYIGDEVKYRLLGRVKTAAQYKMDAKIVGLIVTFESVSPYGYSSPQIVSKSINGSGTITIPCDSDELYSYVYMNTTYTNTSGTTLTIKNNTTGDITTVSGLVSNEIINLSDNMVITSDHPTKTFGNNFNFVFPRLAAGDNDFVVNGNGNISFEYITPVKLGNIAIDINATTDPICDDNNQIVVDTLDWSRISNTPNTLYGYGISDAYTKSSVYTKAEVDAKLANVSTQNVYTKSEVDSKISNVSQTANNASSLASSVSTKLTNNYYTKTEVNSKIDNIDVPDPSWESIKNKPTTTAGYKISDVYTKTEIDRKFANLDASGSIDLSWGSITEKPTTVKGFGLTDVYTKTEVDSKISNINISNIYTKSEVDSMFNSFVPTNVYTKAEVNKLINDIDIPSIDAYTKSEIDSKLNTFMPKNVYTKTEVNSLINNIDSYTKSEIDSMLEDFVSDDVYTKSEVDDLINNLDIPTIDAYTKAEVDNLINNLELPAVDAYTKSEVDEMFSNIDIPTCDAYTKSEVDEMFNSIDVPTVDAYTKEEVDSLINNLDIPTIDTYTKTEIDNKLANITASDIDINEEELNTMLAEVFG